jgi:hypothetical protein
MASQEVIDDGRRSPPRSLQRSATKLGLVVDRRTGPRPIAQKSTISRGTPSTPRGASAARARDTRVSRATRSPRACTRLPLPTARRRIGKKGLPSGGSARLAQTRTPSESEGPNLADHATVSEHPTLSRHCARSQLARAVRRPKGGYGRVTLADDLDHTTAWYSPPTRYCGLHMLARLALTAN